MSVSLEKYARKYFGIYLDDDKNDKIASYKDECEGIISTDESDVVVRVLPTNEEINATSLFAGNGLLVVNEITGNIAIYPVCKIQSAELD